MRNKTCPCWTCTLASFALKIDAAHATGDLEYEAWLQKSCYELAQQMQRVPLSARLKEVHHGNR